MSVTTWRKDLDQAREENNDTSPLEILWKKGPRDYDWDDEGDWPENPIDVEFSNGYGGANGCPFVAWSDEWVYFPCVYDGLEWVGSVPRNPSKTFEPQHFGGGA